MDSEPKKIVKMTMKFPTVEEFEDLLNRSGVMPNTTPDDAIELSERVQNVFALTLKSDKLKTMIEQYVRDHLGSPLSDESVADIVEQLLVMYSQGVLIGMLMFEEMLTGPNCDFEEAT